MNTQLFTKSISTISDYRRIKQKVLNWVRPFNTFCFLDNHQYQIAPNSQECLLGVGARRIISSQQENILPLLDVALQIPGWWMGHLSYDLPTGMLLETTKNSPERIGFPVMYFFEPEILIRIRPDEITIEGNSAQQIYKDILDSEESNQPTASAAPEIKSRMSREEYLDTLTKLKNHILRGDCYEINFCQEFFAENAWVDPISVYQRLSDISPNPFSGLYKLHNSWLACASPERFLKKRGNQLISQPIKGTAPREKADPIRDNERRAALFQNPKDRAENVMVVDLVRNDLARICTEGSVKVDELYGVYSFPQVHQMISTISGELSPDIRFSEIVGAVFPMGSMTGAPKKRVMELIQQYEWSRRGIFSGALGYISPDMDFDFNVVIRSILYNASTGYISFPTGSGITFYSDPEKEWEECLLKAEAMRQALSL